MCELLGERKAEPRRTGRECLADPEFSLRQRGELEDRVVWSDGYKANRQDSEFRLRQRGELEDRVVWSDGYKANRQDSEFRLRQRGELEDRMACKAMGKRKDLASALLSFQKGPGLWTLRLMTLSITS